MIVKIAKWCKTWCNLCIEWMKKDIEFFDTHQIEELLRVIRQSLWVIDFQYISTFTFYGSSVVRHPQFMYLLGAVQELLPHVQFCLDIGDVVPFDSGYLEMLQDLKRKFPIVYIFVRNIDDMWLIRYNRDWRDFFVFLSENPHFLSREPSIRYGKNDYLTLKILSKILWTIPNVVKPIYAKHPYVNKDTKEFFSEKLWTPTCKYHTYLRSDVENTTLIFWHEENEINLMLDGSLTMHTNICYLSKYRYITNVWHTSEKIEQDIALFRENLGNVNARWISLEKACYRCIYGINQ